MRKYFKKILFLIILAVLGLGVFAFSSQAQAAEYYVNDATGNDTGRNCTNSTSQVCKTIIKALSVAGTGGDTISVAPGTYNESVIISKPNITLQGTLDANGNRLTIIDPYVNVSGGWTDMGSGVYTKNLAYKAKALAVEIGGGRYKIPKLCSDTSGLGWEENGPSYCGNWLSWLNRSAEKTYTYTKYGQSYTINMWDGFNALFSYGSGNGVTYVGFDDDSNINNKTIYAATNGDSAIHVSGDYVTVKNFDIRAKHYGVNIVSGADNVTIDNNKITLGALKIHVEGHNAVISNNIITDQNYADYIGLYKHGSWTADTPFSTRLPEDIIKMHLYDFVKFRLTNDNSSFESGAINVFGSNITVTGNQISNMNSGIGIITGDGNYELSNNFIQNMSSIAFFTMVYGGTGYIHDNRFEDSNISTRFQSWEGNGSANNSIVYVYRNTIWNPLEYGEPIFIHFNSDPGPNMPKPGTIWFYHNSYSGARDTYSSSSGINYGMQNIRFVNNIISTGVDGPFARYPGLCAYNWLRKCPACGTGWFGGCSVSNGSYRTDTLMWDTNEIHNFVPTDSRVLNAGIDISKSFAINGITYPALPGFTAGYGGSDGKPDMGAVQSGDIPDNPADVNNDNSVNIKDIHACIKVITGANLTYENQCRVLAAPDMTTNIKDIQVIIQKIINP